VEQCALRTLDLLDEAGLRATFFTLGWTAARLPDLVREVARRGHEVATKGYAHHSVRDMTSAAEFRDDLARGRDAIEDATGTRVVGYRAPGWLAPTSSGCSANSPRRASPTTRASSPCSAPTRGAVRRFAHAAEIDGRTLWEFPVHRSAGGAPPAGGRGELLPSTAHRLHEQAVAYWDRTYTTPFMMYFHTWELDPGQPQITAAPLLKRIRVYRNLDRVPDTLRRFFRQYAFTGVAEHLRLEREAPAVSRADRAPRPVRLVSSDAALAAGAAAAEAAPAVRTRVSVVVPCYNEEATLPYLANTLGSVSAALGGRYELDFVFVDDCSTDATLRTLGALFARGATARCCNHATNRGAAQAILTGSARRRPTWSPRSTATAPTIRTSWRR
jgi:polysaccharide deacetylase family protein (PEP-CTERM system associated)